MRIRSNNSAVCNTRATGLGCLRKGFLHERSHVMILSFAIHLQLGVRPFVYAAKRISNSLAAIRPSSKSLRCRQASFSKSLILNSLDELSLRWFRIGGRSKSHSPDDSRLLIRSSRRSFVTLSSIVAAMMSTVASVEHNNNASAALTTLSIDTGCSFRLGRERVQSSKTHRDSPRTIRCRELVTIMWPSRILKSKKWGTTPSTDMTDMLQRDPKAA